MEEAVVKRGRGRPPKNHTNYEEPAIVQDYSAIPQCSHVEHKMGEYDYTDSDKPRTIPITFQCASQANGSHGRCRAHSWEILKQISRTMNDGRVVIFNRGEPLADEITDEEREIYYRESRLGKYNAQGKLRKIIDLEKLSQASIDEIARLPEDRIIVILKSREFADETLFSLQAKITSDSVKQLIEELIKTRK